MRTLSISCAMFLLASCIFGDEPPKVVFVAGEFEYNSRVTLPKFAEKLQKEFIVETVVLQRPDDEKEQSIPGLEKLEKADLVVLMVRRMVLPEEELVQIKKYLDKGKPLVGLRTASHSFENWKQFDHEVLGGNYQGHHGNQQKTAASLLPAPVLHPILKGVSEFVSDGSLYKNTPLANNAKPLMMGSIDGKPPEPIAWTHEYKGGRIFYTSLGHPNDFKIDSFDRLVRNGIEWALGHPLQKREK